tara:strand:+ start:75 stop:293 length:219 start_codon:yes stop_codon:yes gene_type:complete
MNNNHKINQLIKFLKENDIGLSSTEITIAYREFISQNNNINDFLNNKFGKDWVFLEYKLKEKIVKYLTNIIG